MCGYTNDLMMAVTVGAAAFIGLTPVLFKQVAESGMEKFPKVLFLSLLAISIAFGVSAVIFAIGWLEIQGDWRVLWSQQLFAWEVGICSFASIYFMFSRVVEIGRSKPATRSKRPQKRAPRR